MDFFVSSNYVKFKGLLGGFDHTHVPTSDANIEKLEIRPKCITTV